VSEGNAMNGTISYIELGSENAGATSKFFAGLFDWPFSAMGDAGDGWFDTPTIKAGLHSGDPDRSIVPYFAVADLHEAIAKVRALGGHADEPGPVEPGFGQFCNCRDPQGIKFGLHAR
jgi:uncharacterized protein